MDWKEWIAERARSKEISVVVEDIVLMGKGRVVVSIAQ